MIAFVRTIGHHLWELFHGQPWVSRRRPWVWVEFPRWEDR